MIKLKVYLFLGKFSKYFREMAEHYLITKIENEISIHLSKYKNNHFKILNITHLPNDKNHKIKIDIIYKNISVFPYSFSLLLEYNSDVNNIEKDIELKNEIKKGKIIFEYFKHFENIDKISESLMLQCFHAYNLGKKLPY